MRRKGGGGSGAPCVCEGCGGVWLYINDSYASLNALAWYTQTHVHTHTHAHARVHTHTYTHSHTNILHTHTHNMCVRAALDVLYEDEHILVVNKHAGMVVHPSAGSGRCVYVCVWGVGVGVCVFACVCAHL